MKQCACSKYINAISLVNLLEKINLTIKNKEKIDVSYSCALVEMLIRQYKGVVALASKANIAITK